MDIDPVGSAPHGIDGPPPARLRPAGELLTRGADRRAVARTRIDRGRIAGA